MYTKWACTCNSIHECSRAIYSLFEHHRSIPSVGLLNSCSSWYTNKQTNKHCIRAHAQELHLKMPSSATRHTPHIQLGTCLWYKTETLPLNLLYVVYVHIFVCVRACACVCVRVSRQLLWFRNVFCIYAFWSCIELINSY